MKTKIIPFDLETAKKIQAGEIKGKIKTRCGYDARILCTDLIGQAQPVMAAFITCKSESVSRYTKVGRFYINGVQHDFDLVLEVPDTELDKPQFKPFDRVLVRNEDDEEWETSYFSHIKIIWNILYYVAGNIRWKQCIPYEGNEHLVGTTNKPKED